MLNLVAGAIAMVLCLALQAKALQFGIGVLRAGEPVSPMRGFWRLAYLMVALVAVAAAQMAIWAALYRLLGEFARFEEALYFSGVAFTSLGYGDVTLSPDSRLLAPVEAANGLLMVGISTALFASIVQRSLKPLAARDLG